MTRHYCCYFDHRYITRALAMIRSLRKYEANAAVWVLCLDAKCFSLMKDIAEPYVHLISMADFESGDAALQIAKGNRTLIEYYFTCTPSLIRYVLARCLPNDYVTYVDSDLLFLNDPVSLYEELGDGAVSIIPHRFSDELRSREIYGLYNVGWLTFRNDSRGNAVANWWRDRCNEWCYDRLEGDKFADQKYLDRFAELHEGVVVLRHEGANVAPWNLGQYHVSVKDGAVWVSDTTPIVFFHFHGVKLFGAFSYDVGLRKYGLRCSGVTRKELYRPYITKIAAIAREIEEKGGERAQTLSRGLTASQTSANRALDEMRRLYRILSAFLRGDVVIVAAGKAV